MRILLVNDTSGVELVVVRRVGDQAGSPNHDIHMSSAQKAEFTD